MCDCSLRRSNLTPSSHWLGVKGRSLFEHTSWTAWMTDGGRGRQRQSFVQHRVVSITLTTYESDQLRYLEGHCGAQKPASIAIT
jgi:hypothetical protein